MVRRNVEEQRKLAEKIINMILMGYTQEEIAHRFNISRRTVINYTNKHKDAIYKELNQSIDKQISELELKKNNRIKRIWEIIVNPETNTRDRIKAIQLLQNEEVLTIKRRQMLGLLPQDTPAIAIQNTNVVEGVTTLKDTVKRIFPELIESFKKKKDGLDQPRDI